MSTSQLTATLARNEDLDSSSPLFSERQIAVAAYLATPLAGGCLFAWNAVQLGRTGQAIGSLLAATTVTLLLAVGSQALPIHLGSLVTLGVAMGARKISQRAFEAELKVRRESNIGWRSNWSVLAVMVTTIAVVISAVLTLVQSGAVSG